MFSSSNAFLALCMIFTISSCFANPNPTQVNFLQCLSKTVSPPNPFPASYFYTPANISFESILNSTANNLRYTLPTVAKPQLIYMPLDESHVQASVICARSLGIQLRVRSGGHDYDSDYFFHPIFHNFVISSSSSSPSTNSPKLISAFLSQLKVNMMLARSATRAARLVIPRYLSSTTPATSSGILGTSALSKILGSAGHVNGGEGSHVRGVPVRYNSTAVIDYSTMPSNAAQFVVLTSLVWHMHSGVQDILADYVHHEITLNFTKINLTALSIIVLKDLVI